MRNAITTSFFEQLKLDNHKDTHVYEGALRKLVKKTRFFFMLSQDYYNFVLINVERNYASLVTVFIFNTLVTADNTRHVED